MPLLTNLREKFSRLRSRAKPPLIEEPSQPPAPALLTLPPEIRSMIYTELELNHNTFHILRSETRYLKARHPRGTPQLFCTWHQRCTRPLSPSTDVACPCLSGRTFHGRDEPYHSSAPLLLVCRQLYIETVSILYSQNKFDFGFRFEYITYVARDIGAQNRQAIRDMRFSWPMARDDYRPLWPGNSPPCLTALEECMRTLQEDMGPRLKLTIHAHLESQSQQYSVVGLWAGEWWLEPLARLRAAGMDGMELHVVVCEPWKPFEAGAWEAFQEEVQQLVRRGQGVQSPWVRFEQQFGLRKDDFLCVPGRFGPETALSDTAFRSLEFSGVLG